MEARLPTHDTNIAAALFTLGFPGKCRSVLNDATGKVDITWQMGLHSVTNPRLKDARTIVGDYHNGKLEATAPAHFFLEGLRALRNRERLLSWIKGGRSIRLALVQRDTGCQPVHQRTLYIHGEAQSPPALLGRFQTTDFRLVCALGNFGIPLIHHEGSPGHYRFTVTQGSLLTGSMFNAPLLARSHAAGRLDASHPLAFAMKTLENHSRLVKHTNECRKTLLLRKPGSSKKAFIDEAASDHAFDRVSKFFKI